MLQALIDRSQAHVTGLVRLKLYKGNVQVVGRQAPHSLYDNALATFEADTVYDQRDAEGFIKLNALRLRVLARARATTTPAGDSPDSDGGATAGRVLLRPRQPLFVSRRDPDRASRARPAVRTSAGDRCSAAICSPRAAATRSPARRHPPVRLGVPSARCGALGAYYGVPYREPDGVQFDPRRLALACAAARLGAVEAFSRSLFQALFVDGTSPLDDALCVTLAHQAGVDPGEFRRAIDQPETAADLAATVETASALGVFGVPSFVLGNGFTSATTGWCCCATPCSRRARPRRRGRTAKRSRRP